MSIKDKRSPSIEGDLDLPPAPRTWSWGTEIIRIISVGIKVLWGEIKDFLIPYLVHLL